TEKNENHYGGEDGGDQGFAQDALNGGADEKRLIEKRGHVQAFGKGRGIELKGLLDAGDDVQRGSGADLVNAHEHAALAVGADDVGLRREAVADVGHFAHVDGGAVHGFDGE